MLLHRLNRFRVGRRFDGGSGFKLSGSRFGLCLHLLYGGSFGLFGAGILHVGSRRLVDFLLYNGRLFHLLLNRFLFLHLGFGLGCHGFGFTCRIKVNFSHNLGLLSRHNGLDFMRLLGRGAMLGFLLEAFIGHLVRLVLEVHVGLEFLDKHLIDLVIDARIDAGVDFDALLVQEFLDGLPTHVQVLDDFTDFYRHIMIFIGSLSAICFRLLILIFCLLSE